MRCGYRRWTSTVYLAFHLFLITIQQSTTNKPGLAYHTPADPDDYNIFFSTNSTISWYYNWAPYPSRLLAQQRDVEFLPMIHGISNLASDIKTIKSLDPQPRHILTFNEPDGTTESGGSAIDPEAAAEAYINSILPLRSAPYNYLISQPVTTGSSNGLSWLRSFNTSCWNINPTSGCPSDFIAAHWYGDFPAMASWLGQLRSFYGVADTNENDTTHPIYLTEFALPQASTQTTVSFLNESLAWLDSLSWVAGYAWFGLFRSDEANDWTGDAVSMLDDNGGLTEIGSLYLGGERRGFRVGERSEASHSTGTGSGGNGGGGNDESGMTGMSLATKNGITRLGYLVGLVVGLSWWSIC